MKPVTVLGVGPGDPELLTLKAQRCLQGAEFVAGFETVIRPIRQWTNGVVWPMRYSDQEEVLDRLVAEAALDRRCVLCVWGDSTFSARELLERLRSRTKDSVFIPGVSSVQIACSRMGFSLEDTIFLTLHAQGQNEQTLEETLGHLRNQRRHIVLLPRPFTFMPADIARALIQSGIPDEKVVFVLERLTFPDERKSRLTFGELALSTTAFSDLTILAMPATERPWIHPG